MTIFAFNKMKATMYKINLITFGSVFLKTEISAIYALHSELMDALKNEFEVNIIFAKDFTQIPSDGITLAFIATGGTEGIVRQIYSKLPHPIILLTDGKANSLAASLEISCWIRQRGDSCSILHGHTDYIIECIKQLPGSSSTKGQTVQTTHPTTTILEGQRIGVIGEPSDWLIASQVDYASAKENWGVEFVDIPLETVNSLYEATDETQATLIANKFKKQSMGCIEPTFPEIIKAARLYLALKQLAVNYQLNALTIQCFSLISSLSTTGCMALALLNDEGIVAGCEGDLQTVFTMLLIKQSIGKDGFMANPAFVDIQANEVLLAHCTIGLKQTEGYIIRSHFESQSGVALQGIMPKGDVTIIKVGGTKLDRAVCLHGKLLENQNDSRKCRTQVKIALDSSDSVSYFLTESIGNHHVIVEGHVNLP